jgi:hypothetical protein
MQRNYTLRIITSVASFGPACAKDQRRAGVEWNYAPRRITSVASFAPALRKYLRSLAQQLMSHHGVRSPTIFKPAA